MRGISVARRLVHSTKIPIGAPSFSSLNGRTLGASAISSPSTVPESSSTTTNNKNSAVSFQFSHQISRSFSSSPSGPSNIVLVESEEQFNSSLRQVQDE